MICKSGYRSSTRAGVTLIEVIIIVLLLTAAIALAQKGVGVVNTLVNFKASMEAQSMADAAISRLIQELKNANNIVTLEPGKLVFTVFNTERGYDVNQFDFLDPATFGTVAYEFVTTPQGARLKRTVDFPAAALRHGVNAAYHEEGFLCTNILVPPDTSNLASVKATSIFAPIFGWTAAPFSMVAADKLDAVRISFRVKPPLAVRAVRTFEQDITLRSRVI